MPVISAYTAETVVYSKGSAISSNSPTTSGGDVVTWAISPSLPGGLSMDTSTGVITGTPNAITSQATYTVTGTNTGGSDTIDLVITVNDGKISSVPCALTT